jgi:hypothetical protein
MTSNIYCPLTIFALCYPGRVSVTSALKAVDALETYLQQTLAAEYVVRGVLGSTCGLILGAVKDAIVSIVALQESN